VSKECPRMRDTTECSAVKSASIASLSLECMFESYGGAPTRFAVLRQPIPMWEK
jgi:hypothetical protein